MLDIYPTPMIMLYYVKHRHSAFRMSMRYHTRIKNIYLWIKYGQSRNDFGKFAPHAIIETLCVPDRIKHLNFILFFLSKTLFENIPVSEKFNHLTRCRYCKSHLHIFYMHTHAHTCTANYMDRYNRRKII